MRCLNCGFDKLPLNSVHCTNCGVHLPSLLRDCLEAGTMLHHDTYRIDYPLGRGGFGITYRAFDIGLERSVAIKEFYPQEHAFREGLTGRLVIPHTKHDVYHRGLQRFLREGTLLAKLKHSGVVDVYNAFQERDTAYLVMELIKGRTLRDELEEQPERRLNVDRIREIMSQLVSALTVVHQRGVYHLDIAPDNAIMSSEGRVVLIDFGASRQGLGGGTTQAFKEAYAPPEVIDGKHTDARSDLFELGMMLHELLTGTLPPSSISRLLSYAHHGAELWDSMQVAEPWRGLISSAIRLNPDERPKDVQAWWDAHQFANQETVLSPQRTPTPQRIPTPPPRIPTPSPIPPTIVIPKPASTPTPIPAPIPVPARDFIATPIASPTAPKYAGFWLRLVADLIDRTLLVLASAIVLAANRYQPDNADNYFNAIFYTYIPLGLLYTTVLESSRMQATFGKQLMGIQVTDRNWKRLTLQRAFVRDLCKIFSYVTLGLGFLMASFTETRQALHDRITNCFVIRKS
ncbi:protein kinase domain-containing protein [Leptolyngbya sp. NIES-2104]|uniref:protein kinase domain-containing protein n=1 Tax=Leptolyngbya sp. NIES-2104 TaxID=1552121 RepID=UPI00073EE9A6|nr:RDD family protein [Leptolyngbya sp. NIES-2104]